MKSIVYILITVFISSILISAFPKNNSKSLRSLTLQCVSDNHSVELLNKSAGILQSRLNDYGIQNVNIYINEKLSNIDISFENNASLSDVIYLLESKGQIEFFETFDRKEVINNLGLDKELVQILNIPTDNKTVADNSGIYGYCKENNKSKVESFIEKHYVSKPGEGINFYWSERPNSNGDFYLYLLLSHPSLDNSFISKSWIKTDENKHELTITFDKSGKTKWEDITKRNVGKSIAIVLDKKVLHAPIVQAEIEGGKCIITGDFSLNEISRISSLINNEELPLDFKVNN